MEPTDILNWLRFEIRKLRRPAANRRRYIDPESLRALFAGINMTNVCKACGFPQHKCYVYGEKIRNTSSIIFTTLLSIGQEGVMSRFIEKHVHDDRLPLAIETLTSIAPEIASGFLEAQWTALPFVLESEYQRIDKDYIIPFDKDERLADLDGSYGEIYEVRMLASMQHLVPKDASEVIFIRKKLRSSSDDTSFKQEQEVLELLRTLRHPNIVELFCSYTYESEHSLLFPRLDMDLERFFSLEKRFGAFQWDNTFFTAISGLSSALNFIHNLHLTEDEHKVELTRIGYHHDIRPRNILVNSNTFLLTDFGLAKMKRVEKGSQSKWKDINSDYVAPECMDADFNDQSVGRAVDIWAIGCLIIDIVSYMVWGPSGRSDAQKHRLGSGSYPSIKDSWFFSGSSLKKGVITWVNQLRGGIEDKSLQGLDVLLDLSMEILLIRPDDRPSSEELHRKSFCIAIKSLFEAAKIGLNKFDGTEAGDRPSIGPWLNDQLTQWGGKLGLTESGNLLFMSRDLGQGQKLESFYQENLLRIIKISSKNPSTSIAATARLPIELLERHQQRANELYSAIQELKHYSPQTQNKSIDCQNEEGFCPTHRPKLSTCTTPNFNATWRSFSISPTADFRHQQPRSSPTSPRSGPISLWDTNRSSVPTSSNITMRTDSTESEQGSISVQIKQSPRSRKLPTFPLLSEPAIISLGREILARITYTDQSATRHSLESKIEFSKCQTENKTAKSVIWTDRDGELDTWHILSEGEYAYPHIDRPIPTNKSVYLLGHQVLIKQVEAPQKEFFIGLKSQGLPAPQEAPAPIRTNVQTIIYSIDSDTDRKRLREFVWGKRLVDQVGADKVSLPSLSPDPESVCVSLWESAGIRTIVFRAKKTREFIEVRVASPKPVKTFKESSNTLVVSVWPLNKHSKTPSSTNTEPAILSGPALDTGIKYIELKIKFHGHEDEDRTKLQRALESPFKTERTTHQTTNTASSSTTRSFGS